jgi:hypothetical protein
VAKEQAGGRVGRSSSDMATKTVITHEICNLQQLTGAVVYNDAKACFDRIIENMSNLACMREGLAPQLATLHSQTLQKMQYFIKTHHGCGKHYNCHMHPDPFLGSGQGAGDSMARWGFVSDALIRAYNKAAVSSPIVGPISKTLLTEKIQAFVDDSHGIIIKGNDSPLSLDELLQYNMQTWESLRYAVGGKLEINKCKYLKFNDNHDHLTGPPQPGVDHNTRTITITDHDTNEHTLLTEISTATP